MSGPTIDRKETKAIQLNHENNFDDSIYNNDLILDSNSYAQSSTSSASSTAAKSEGSQSYKRKNLSSMLDAAPTTLKKTKLIAAESEQIAAEDVKSEEPDNDQEQSDAVDSNSKESAASQPFSVERVLELIRSGDEEDPDYEDITYRTDVVDLWEVVRILLTGYSTNASNYFSDIIELLDYVDPNRDFCSDFIGNDLLDACLKRAVLDGHSDSADLLKEWGASYDVGISAAIEIDSVEMLELFEEEIEPKHVKEAAQTDANNEMSVEILRYFLKQDFNANSEIILQVAIEKLNVDLVEIVCASADIEQVYDLIKILVKSDRAILLVPFFEYFSMEELLKEIREQDEEEGVYKTVLDQAKNFMSSKMMSDDELREFIAQFDEIKLEENFLVYPNKEFNGDQTLKELREAFNDSLKSPDENKCLASFIGVHSSTANRYLIASPYSSDNPESSEKYFRSGHHPFNIFAQPKVAKYQFNQRLAESKVNQSGANAANFGGYQTPLASLLQKQRVPVSRLPQEELQYPKDSALYDQLLHYRHGICQYIVTNMQLPEKAAIKVGFYNSYPCVMVLIETPRVASQATPAAIEGWTQIIISYFIGMVNYWAQKNGLAIELIRRSSFGFLTPTIAPCGQSFRLNVGIIPKDYVRIIIQCLIILDNVLALLQGDVEKFDVELPENCFINDKDYAKYLGDKKPDVANVLDLIWAKVEKGGRTGAMNLMKSTAARDGFAAQVYSEIASIDLDSKELSPIERYTKVFLSVLQSSFGNLYLKKATKKIELSYRNATEIKFAAILQHHAQIHDDEFFKFIALILDTVSVKRPSYIKGHVRDKNLNRSVENNLQEVVAAIDRIVQAKVVTELYYQLEMLNELLYCDTLAKFYGQAIKEDCYGSNSDGEDASTTVKIYYDKVIVQNGMRAILTALHAGIDCSEESITDNDHQKRTLFIHGAYYETLKAIKLLEKFTVIQRVADIAQAEILIHDANICVTDQKELDDLSVITDRQLAKIKVLIVDSTSATADQCHEWLDKFREQNNMRILCFVSSGFKNEQFGADKNPYGTVRVFTKEKKLRDNILEFITKHEKPINSSVAHHYRRYMKSLGATLRNCSIVSAKATREVTSHASTSTSSIYSDSAPSSSSSSSPQVAATSANLLSTSMALSGLLSNSSLSAATEQSCGSSNQELKIDNVSSSNDGNQNKR